MSNNDKSGNDNANLKKKSAYKIVIEQITGIFLPVINIITAASLIKSAVVLLATFGVLSTNGGVYQLFYAVSDGFFYFLPFFLAITTSKQWKTDPFVSVLIPTAMLYPGITAILENNLSLDFIGLTIPPTIYHSSVIPVILAIGLLAFVERPLERCLPDAIKGFMKPIISIIIVLPVTFMVFGPMGTWIGDGLTKIFFMLYDWNPVIAGAFMGFVMQPMVVVGAHWSVVPVSISNIATMGYDVIMPLVGGAVYGQSGAALAVGMMLRKNEKGKENNKENSNENNNENSRLAFQASLTAALGVTEPALFGINVPRVKPMIAACFAGLIGGAIVGVAGTHCTSFAFPSFLTCVAYVGPGFMMFLGSMALSFVLGFIFTMIIYKGKMEE